MKLQIYFKIINKFLEINYMKLLKTFLMLIIQVNNKIEIFIKNNLIKAIFIFQNLKILVI